MRKSFDTLAVLVQSRLGRDPTSGDAFVFIGKRSNRLKMLTWEDIHLGCWAHVRRKFFELAEHDPEANWFAAWN